MKKISLVLSIILFSIGTMIAQRSVTGSVKDEAGNPLIGASVLVKGTESGTITDIDGKFSISIEDARNLLIVSYTGFQTMEVQVDESNKADITLTEGMLLKTAVVSALGISREEKSLGYSSQNVGGEELSAANESNVINALSGRLAGVNITASSGSVGASSTINLRGNSTIGGSGQPLFVVNGVPYSGDGKNENSQYGGVDYGNPINDINPNDIESITVLKGPNAAALYGSRGMNGVIVITTKTGKNVKKGLGVSYSGSYSFSNPLKLPDFQNKFGQGIDHQFKYVDGIGGGLYDGVDESWGPAFDSAITENDGIDNDGDGEIDESGEGQLIDQFSGANQPWIARPDNIRNLFDTGITGNHALSITAGGDKMSGRFSFANTNQKGMVPNTELKKNVITTSFNMKPSSLLNLEGYVNYTNTKSDNRPGVGYDSDNVITQSIWAGRQVDWDYLRENYDRLVTLQDGSKRYLNWNHSYQNNPFHTLNNNTKPMNRNRVNGYAEATLNFTDHLNLKTKAGNDFYNETRERRSGYYTVDYINGAYATEELSFNETNLQTTLNYSNKFGRLGLVSSIGANRMDQRYSNQLIEIIGLTVPGIYNVSNAKDNPQLTQFSERKRINSVYGMIALEFDNFLYLDVTGRQEWTSTLEAGNNSYFYPSVNAAVVLSEKLNLPSSIDFLKIRGSWASVGNDTRAYRTSNVLLANNPFDGIPSFAVQNRLNSSDLRPEFTQSLELGLDYRMFNNRIGLDFTYYNAKTYDQIISLSVSGASGYTNRFTNAGTVENEGLEVQLSLTPVKRPKFQWDVNVNWAKNTSMVMDLPEGVDEIVMGSNWGLKLTAREGEPLGTFRGLSAVYEGDKLVLDSGLPQSETEESSLGSINPDWTGGILNSFKFGNFDLNFLIDAKMGGDLFSVSYMFGRYAGVLEETLKGRNTLEEIAEGYAFDGVVDNGDGTFSPNTVKVDAATWNAYYYNGYAGHDRAIFDASFVKLREASLSYTFNKNILNKLPFENLSLGVYGTNLAILFSNVPHIDPETSFNDNPATRGFEFGQLPSARTVGVRLNASF